MPIYKRIKPEVCLVRQVKVDVADLEVSAGERDYLPKEGNDLVSMTTYQQSNTPGDLVIPDLTRDNSMNLLGSFHFTLKQMAQLRHETYD